MATIYIDVNELSSRTEDAAGWAARNDTVYVTRYGQTLFRLVPNGSGGPTTTTPPPTGTTTAQPVPDRKLGLHPGTTTLPPDFNQPMSDEFLTGGER